MKKPYLTLASILLISGFIFPLVSHATFTIPWTATSTDQGVITPTAINGKIDAIQVPYIIATSTTATSTFMANTLFGAPPLRAPTYLGALVYVGGDGSYYHFNGSENHIYQVVPYEDYKGIRYFGATSTIAINGGADPDGGSYAITGYWLAVPNATGYRILKEDDPDYSGNGYCDYYFDNYVDVSIPVFNDTGCSYWSSGWTVSPNSGVQIDNNGNITAYNLIADNITADGTIKADAISANGITLNGPAGFTTSNLTVGNGLYNSYLTSGRVPYTTTNGLLTDSTNLTFNGTTLTANTLNLTNALGVGSGGTGLTTAPTFGQLLVGNALGGYNLFSTSSLNLSIPLASTTGTLSVANGGTGQTSFGQGWLASNGTTITSSTSPTVNYITATSTTATTSISTGGFTVGGNQFLVQQGTGNIGIGTTTPARHLDIANSDSLSQILLEDTNAISNLHDIGIKSSQGNFSINSMTDALVPTARFLIASTTGNVGIGTTSPYTQLSVQGNAVADTFTTGSSSPLTLLNVSRNLTTAPLGTTQTFTLYDVYNYSSATSPRSLNTMFNTLQDSRVQSGLSGTLSDIDLSAQINPTGTYNGPTANYTAFLSQLVDGETYGRTNGNVAVTMVGDSIPVDIAPTIALGSTRSLTYNVTGINIPYASGYHPIYTSGTFSAFNFTGVNINGSLSATAQASTSIAIAYSCGLSGFTQNWCIYNTGADNNYLGTGFTGIGTTSPYAILSIAGLSNGTSPLLAISTSTSNSTSTAFLIDQNGNVGIGTSTPYSTSMLDINGTTTIEKLGSHYNTGVNTAIPCVYNSKGDIGYMTVTSLVGLTPTCLAP